ncbi:MAG: glycosyltransferase [Rubripirellula sp.]|nr:glycosyltransferase [Rubripirellula sp.]
MTSLPSHDPSEACALGSAVPTREGEHPSVTLVIPGRNCAATLDRCLQSVVPLKESGQLAEIIFVNDGSTDRTAEIATSFPEVTVVSGSGEGAAAARNLGAGKTKSDLIWFVDSDCVAEPDALSILVRHFDDTKVAGAGGTYTNGCPDSLLATIIHEEIVARHATMPSEVNHLATYDVVYRRDMFQELGGFRRGLGRAEAEDVELAYRVVDAGWLLRFDRASRVQHHHPTSLRSYLAKQARHGFYRMKLYAAHPKRAKGDSYTSRSDIAQPLLAAAVLPACALSCLPTARSVGLVMLSGLLILLALACLPMGLSIWRRTKKPTVFMGYLCLAYVRSFYRAAGMVLGVATSLPSLAASSRTKEAIA